MAEETKKKKKKPTAVKRILQSEKRNLRNKKFKSTAKTAIKNLKSSVDNKASKEEIAKGVNLVFSIMDKGVKKNIFKKNKASHVKSRCSKVLVK